MSPAPVPGDAAPTGGELFLPVVVAKLPHDGRTLDIEADAAARKALAQRYDVIAVESLTARMQVRPLGARRGITRAEVRGHFEATVIQTCVVTLEPLTRSVADDIALRFSDEETTDAGAPSSRAIDIDPLADESGDPPEVLENGTIDIGAVVAEALGLALDPYPRSEGATLEADPVADTATTADADASVDQDGAAQAGPFAALAALRTDRDT